MLRTLKTKKKQDSNVESREKRPKKVEKESRLNRPLTMSIVIFISYQFSFLGNVNNKKHQIKKKCMSHIKLHIVQNDFHM